MIRGLLGALDRVLPDEQIMAAGRGLLGQPQQIGGLLGNERPQPPQMPAPRPQAEQSPRGVGVGGFLDALFFGGRAGEALDAVRARNNAPYLAQQRMDLRRRAIGGDQQAMQELIVQGDDAADDLRSYRSGNAQQQAFQAAIRPDGTFDSGAYRRSLAQYGVAPGVEDIVRLDTADNNRAEAGRKATEFVRQTAAGVAASIMSFPPEQRAMMVQGQPPEVVALLGDLSDAAIQRALALGMGADAYADNARDASQFDRNFGLNREKVDIDRSRLGLEARRTAATEEAVKRGLIGFGAGNAPTPPPGFVLEQ